MKKNALPLLIALGFLSLTNCRKDSEPTRANQVNAEQSASDRGGCPRDVTISGGAGVTVCGNLNAPPGSSPVCYDCDTPYLPAIRETNNAVTYSMKADCFTIINPTNTTQTVNVQVWGQSCSNNYNIPRNSSLRLCITELAGCCQTVSADCPVIGPGGGE